MGLNVNGTPRSDNSEQIITMGIMKVAIRARIKWLENTTFPLIKGVYGYERRSVREK